MRLASSKGPQFEDPRVAETAGPRRIFSVDRVPESECSPPGPLSFEPEPSNRATKRPTHAQRRQPHAEGRPTKQQQGPCLACHREGHVAKNCPTWKGRCYRCRKEGHTSESCSLPDKRGKATRITANDNRELARALANITQQLQEIKAQLRPDWAWRTLRPFRERIAKHNPPRKPPEETKVTEPKINFPQITPKDPWRTDLQGCDPPPHMHIGANNTTMPKCQRDDTNTRQDHETVEDPGHRPVTSKPAKLSPLNHDAAPWKPVPRFSPWALVASVEGPDGKFRQVNGDKPEGPDTKITYIPQLMPRCYKCGEDGHRYSDCRTDAHLQREPDHHNATPPSDDDNNTPSPTPSGISKPAPWILALENLRNKPPTSTTHHETSPPSEENYDTPSPTPSELQREEEYYNQNDDWDDS